jgi:deoxyribonuclease-1
MSPRIALLLFTLVSCQLQAAGQQVHSKYLDALPVFWDHIYPQGGETLYCGRKFGPYRGHGINIEHVFPMSWVAREEGCRNRKFCQQTSRRFNYIEADMHNLYPARTEINKARGSFPYGEIAGEKRAFGDCDFEFHPRSRLVEPRPASRGNIARAMFYMHDTYGLTIYAAQGRLLKKWHREDPPDREERRRNDLIARHQGVRNRFIDNPNLAEELKF